MVSSGSNSLFDNFIKLAQELEELGFVHSKGQVIILDTLGRQQQDYLETFSIQRSDSSSTLKLVESTTN